MSGPRRRHSSLFLKKEGSMTTTLSVHRGKKRKKGKPAILYPIQKSLSQEGGRSSSWGGEGERKPLLTTNKRALSFQDYWEKRRVTGTIFTSTWEKGKRIRLNTQYLGVGVSFSYVDKRLSLSEKKGEWATFT